MKSKWRRVLLGTFIGYIILFCVPVFPGVKTYRAVDSVSKSSESINEFLKNKVSNNDFEVESHDLYAVKSGRLFLLCQSTRSAVVMVTFVSFTRWNEQTIEAFRRDHPELESSWPEPSRKDGGVPWLTAQQEASEGRACIL